MSRFSKWITLPLGSASGAIVFILMALTVADVVLRKMAGQGVAGVVEYSEVLLVVGIFLAIAAAQVEGFHVSTSVLTSRLPTSARRVAEAIGALVGAFFVAFMAYVATQSAWVSFVTGEYRFGLATVAVWPARAAVAIGLWLYFAEYVRAAIKRFKNPVDERDFAEEVAKAEKGVIL